MKLYHGTTQIFQTGQVIRATNQTAYYPEAVDVLENAKPSAAPSRRLCVFAADSPVAAASFMRSQGVQDFSIFEVEMPKFHRAPFCIIHELANRIKCGVPYYSLVQEYWTSKVQWKFYEYFGPEMIIMGKVDAPSTIEDAAFIMSYGGDKRMVSSL